MYDERLKIVQCRQNTKKIKSNTLNWIYVGLFLCNNFVTFAHSQQTHALTICFCCCCCCCYWWWWWRLFCTGCVALKVVACIGDGCDNNVSSGRRYRVRTCATHDDVGWPNRSHRPQNLWHPARHPHRQGAFYSLPKYLVTNEKYLFTVSGRSVVHYIIKSWKIHNNKKHV